MSNTRPPMKAMPAFEGAVGMTMKPTKRTAPALRVAGKASRKSASAIAVGFGGADFLDTLTDVFTPPGFLPRSVGFVPNHGQWEDMERIGEDFASAAEVLRAGNARR